MKRKSYSKREHKEDVENNSTGIKTNTNFIFSNIDKEYYRALYYVALLRNILIDTSMTFKYLWQQRLRRSQKLVPI